MRNFIFILLLVSAHSQAGCPITGLDDRLAASIGSDGRYAFRLLADATKNPDLLNSPAFRDRLALAMENAGMDAKDYLAPQSETGPIPSQRLVKSWFKDIKAITVCE